MKVFTPSIHINSELDLGWWNKRRNKNKGRKEEWICFLYFIFFSFFFFLNLFYWSMVDLQCCLSFQCTAKWFSYTSIYILFHILFHYGLLQDMEYSSLCYTVGPDCLSILYIIVFFFHFHKTTCLSQWGDPLPAHGKMSEWQRGTDKPQ